MAVIRLPVLTLLLLLALQQVQAEPWTVWACEGDVSARLNDAPGSGQVCCKYEGDGAGTFTTDVGGAHHLASIDRRLGLSD